METILYNTLGLAPTCTSEQIQQAYDHRRQNPYTYEDLYQSNSLEHAYAILIDPESREEYHKYARLAPPAREAGAKHSKGLTQLYHESVAASRERERQQERRMRERRMRKEAMRERRARNGHGVKECDIPMESIETEEDVEMERDITATKREAIEAETRNVLTSLNASVEPDKTLADYDTNADDFPPSQKPEAVVKMESIETDEDVEMEREVKTEEDAEMEVEIKMEADSE